MSQLTQKEVLNMTTEQRQETLDLYQDKACNIDYVLQPIESDIVQRNINLLESKLLYNEF